MNDQLERKKSTSTNSNEVHRATEKRDDKTIEKEDALEADVRLVAERLESDTIEDANEFDW